MPLNHKRKKAKLLYFSFADEDWARLKRAQKNWPRIGKPKRAEAARELMRWALTAFETQYQIETPKSQVSQNETSGDSLARS